ncbi:hypothetical protein QC762_0071510 [Podospora pseudocomata]|uniref:Fungal N-terminal domain-containing protein n=1 Tax=Podospora pseudocomata TaxID=2093779 RepID=A0ABR0GGW1_9PEZI|nr:hypothetical protein QC762_0071510 [Podospora pseudocomata]
MADALAVSGLAASIISLGIQVGGGIIKYLDVIKGRDENIACIRRLVDSLTENLRILEACSTFLHPSYPVPTTTLMRNLTNELLAHFTTQGQSSKRQDTIKRSMTYPLERSKLTQLLDLSQALNLAALTLGLQVSDFISSKLADVESNTHANSSKLDAILSQFLALNVSINDGKAALSSAVSSIRDSNHDLGNRIQDSHCQQAANHLQVTDQLLAIKNSQHVYADTFNALKSQATSHHIELIEKSQATAQRQIELGIQLLNEVSQLREITRNFIKDHDSGGYTPSSADTTIYRLLSKPNALRTICDSSLPSRKTHNQVSDGVTSHGSTSNSPGFEEPVSSLLAASLECQCRPRTRRMRKDWQFSHFGSLFKIIDVEESHFRGCSFNKASRLTTRERARRYQIHRLETTLPKGHIDVSYLGLWNWWLQYGEGSLDLVPHGGCQDCTSLEDSGSIGVFGSALAGTSDAV